MGADSLFEPASSGHLHYSFWRFYLDFISLSQVVATWFYPVCVGKHACLDAQNMERMHTNSLSIGVIMCKHFQFRYNLF